MTTHSPDLPVVDTLSGTGSPDEREDARVAVLHAYGLLDTPSEPDYDDLAALAAQVCGTPMSAVTLVGADRQFNKAEVGLGARELPRATSFCAHSLHRPDDLLLVPDARLDARFADNALVTGPTGVRSYAGAPVVTADGVVLGSVCVLDVRPRTFTAAQQTALRKLAKQCLTLHEAHRTAQRLAVALAERDLAARAASQSELAASGAFDQAPIGLALLTEAGRVQRVNGRLARAFGVPAADLVGRSWSELSSAGADEELGSGVQQVVLQTSSGSAGAVLTRQVLTSDAGPVLHLLRVEPHDERDRAEALLLEAQSATDALVTVGAAGRIMSWNVGAERMFGHDRSSVLGRTLEVIVPPQLWPHHSAGLHALRAGGPSRLGSRPVVVPAVRADGSTVMVELTLSHWERDGSVFTTAVLRDVTERLASEAAARRTQELAALVSRAALAANSGDEIAVVVRAVLQALCAWGGWAGGRLRLLPVGRPDLVWHADGPGAEAGPARPRVVDPDPVLQVPVLVGDAAVAVLELHGPGGPDPDPALSEVLHEVGLQIGRVVERERAQAQLQRQAREDALTGLPNRAFLVRRLREACARLGPGARRLGVLFIDLDRFKQVNDTHGHAVGDEVLAEVARRLSGCLRVQDVLARIGGDEFVVLCEDLGGALEAQEVAERLVDALAPPFVVGGTVMGVGASIGVVTAGSRADADELLVQADSAMYDAKAAGRHGFAVFDAEALSASRRRAVEHAALQRALERGELTVHYQPVVDLDSGRPVGTEALVRWTLDGVAVPPDRFIPLAEDSGLIVELGAWVLHEACAQLVRWTREDPSLARLHVAVNLSMRQLRDGGVVDLVCRTLSDTGLAAERLVLELTETALAEDDDHVHGQVAALSALGVSVAIDDFGTGWSSLSYLQRFAVDTLKIDRRFVRRLGDAGPVPPSDAPAREGGGTGHGEAIATVVLGVARALGLGVVAEGVETEAHAQALRRLGCARAQGYLFARPLPAEEVPAALRRLARRE